MRYLLAAFFAMLAIDARATSSPDYSDLWSNASEPGWGVNVIQQDQTLFTTIFVYGAGTTPTWYVASEMRPTSSDTTFSGTLYSAVGPPFSAATFNPLLSSIRPVGNVTIWFDSPTVARLQYTVDAIVVRKVVARQTWAMNNVAGDYVVTATGSYANCPDRSGYAEEFAFYKVVHTSDRISLSRLDDSGCMHAGTYTQTGRLGAVEAITTCQGIAVGTLRISELENNRQGFSGAGAITSTGGCRWSGRLAGLRRGP